MLDGDPAPLPQRGWRAPPQFSAHFYCGQTTGWMKLVLGMEVGLSPGDFALDGDPAPSPIFGPFLLRPNGWMHQDATWYGYRPQPRGFVLDGDPVPLPKKGANPPKFSGHVYCGQTAGWIKMPLGMKVGLSPGDCVRYGPSPPPHKEGGAPPQFSAHFYCGQTTGCIKMPLGMEVGLSPGDLC